MLKLRKIRLQQLEKDRISSFSMNQLIGGHDDCTCGCIYYGTPGGSQTASNNSANTAYGLHTPGYDPCTCSNEKELARLISFWENKK